MKRNSIDHATMRDMNLTLILSTLRQHAPLSRSQLAAHTGLNKATVSSIVKELLASELVYELGSTNGTFVNEIKIESKELADGDQVRFGGTTVIYSMK